MKRILAFLLALIMVLALCACGNKEAAPAFDEKAAGAELTDNASETQAPQKNNFNDAVAFEDIRIERVKGASSGDKPLYRIGIKIRNNYVPEDGELAADRFIWEAKILNQQGDIVKTLVYLAAGAEYGEAIWDTEDFAVDDWSSISSIRVKSYNLYKLGGEHNSTFLGTGELTEPVVFNIADIEIVE